MAKFRLDLSRRLSFTGIAILLLICVAIGVGAIVLLSTLASRPWSSAQSDRTRLIVLDTVEGSVREEDTLNQETIRLNRRIAEGNPKMERGDLVVRGRLSAERAAKERAAAERVAAERVAAERVAAEKGAAEMAIAERSSMGASTSERGEVRVRPHSERPRTAERVTGPVVEERQPMRAAPARAVKEEEPLLPAAIAWNTPPEMQLDTSAEVELRISITPEQMPGIADRITAPGKTTTEAFEVSRVVIATLASADFVVEPAGPQRAQIRRGRDAQWRWIIKPKTAGSHLLVLQIESEMKLANIRDPFTRTIQVRAVPVSAWKAPTEFAVKNWRELLTVVLLPLAGLAAREWKLRRNARKDLADLPVLDESNDLDAGARPS